MSPSKIIEVNKNICGGKPRIKGTRLKVETILGCFAHGLTTEEIISNVGAAGTKITKTQIKAALLYSARELSKN